jgi:hypothetical protein
MGRGMERSRIFRNDSDRKDFLSRLGEPCKVAALNEMLHLNQRPAFLQRLNMEKALFIIIGCLVVLFSFGCAYLPQPWTPPPTITKSVNMGPMMVVIINPSDYVCRHVWLFNGSDRVKLIGDSGTGRPTFDRPPIAEFLIEIADGDRHKDFSIYLPLNSSFILYDQPKQPFWGFSVGEPNQIAFSTGSDPGASTCQPRTPRMSTFYRCAACIQLPYVKPSDGALIDFLLRKPRDWRN